MKMKKLKNLIEIFVMVAMFCFAILIVSKVSAHQYTSHEVRIKNFFSMPENTVDVAFIGASEMYTGFSPEYLWKEHGVTSYNIATAGAHMGLPENQIKAILKTQKPKLFVVSLNGAQYDDKRAVAEGYTRMWLDNMPESDVRREGIETLVEGDKASYKYKILKYHSNILNFKASMALTKRELKGARDKRLLTISGIEGQASKNKDAFPMEHAMDMSKYNAKSPLQPKTKKQFYRLLDYLKKENIQNVVFVNMPVFYDKRNPKGLLSKRRFNTAMEICRQYGFKAFDFTTEVKDIGLDVKEDYYNQGHLNAKGQRKMTDYFYNKVIAPMGIKSDLNQENTKLWDENAKVYEKTYQWIKKIIDNELPYPFHYNYKVVDHIINGTIDKYESTLRFKGKIIEKKRQEELEQERKNNKNKPVNSNKEDSNKEEVNNKGKINGKKAPQRRVKPKNNVIKQKNEVNNQKNESEKNKGKENIPPSKEEKKPEAKVPVPKTPPAVGP